LVNRIDSGINQVFGEYGITLIAAMANGCKPQAVRLLVEHGVDVSRLGGKYRTMIGATFAIPTVAWSHKYLALKDT